MIQQLLNVNLFRISESGFSFYNKTNTDTKNHCGPDLLTCSLNAAWWYPLLGIILCVVHVSVLHVGNVQPGHITIVTEYPE